MSRRDAAEATLALSSYAVNVTDANLRALERRFRESGAVEDEAAWLLERVRVGELEQSKLELAAWCEHAPAHLACEGRVPPFRWFQKPQ